MDFNQLLSGLQGKYKELQEEAKQLRKERSQLVEELARLRAGIPEAGGPSCLTDGRPVVLPGSVPDLVPAAAAAGAGPPAVPTEGPSALLEAGALSVRAVAAAGLRRGSGSGDGDPGGLAPGVFFVSAQLQGGGPQFSPLRQGPDATWSEFAADFSVDVHDQVLGLEVFESKGPGAPAVSLGIVSVPFRSLPSGGWQSRKEAVSATTCVLEFEVRWSPAQRQRRAEPPAASKRAATAELAGAQDVEQSGVEAAVRSPQAFKRASTQSGSRITAVNENWLDEHILARQHNRFRKILGTVESDSSFRVTAEVLAPVLHKRGMPNMTERWLDSALLEISRIVPERQSLLTPHQATSFTSAVPALLATPAGVPDGLTASMSLEAFVEAIHTSDLSHQCDPSKARGIRKMQEVLLKQDLDEVIDRLTRVKELNPSNSPSNYRGQLMKAVTSMNMAVRQGHLCCVMQESTIRRIDNWLGAVVSVTVLASVLCLALSRDYLHASALWTFLEFLFVVIFVTEIVIKIVLHGNKRFWCGEDKFWNWFDFMVTIVSIVDVFMNIVADYLSNGHSIGRLALALRVFRLLRLARVLKMVRSPFIRELANMLIGFLLGSPALFWVMIIIWFVVGLIALGLRMVIGPEPGAELLMDKCGSGDSPTPGWEEDPACKLHDLYAEEYCGTVVKCMFTVFRCMTGDCSTKGGQSLSEHLSAGYGLKFNVAYCVGMVILIFGVFNVITAIFVEATLAGLKYNETKQKLRSMYEGRYVKKKLKELIARISDMRDLRTLMGGRPSVPSLTESWDSSFADSEYARRYGNISLTEEEFVEVMKDEEILLILEQLDIDVTGNHALFEVMDPNNVGKVDLASMIDALFKLRGGLMKMDMIANWVAIRGLRQEFRDLTLSMGVSSRKEVAA